jgi:hypothetical protein
MWKWLGIAGARRAAAPSETYDYGIEPLPEGPSIDVVVGRLADRVEALERASGELEGKIAQAVAAVNSFVQTRYEVPKLEDRLGALSGQAIGLRQTVATMVGNLQESIEAVRESAAVTQMVRRRRKPPARRRRVK